MRGSDKGADLLVVGSRGQGEDQRVDIEFGDQREIRGEPGDPVQHIGKRGHVRGAASRNPASSRADRSFTRSVVTLPAPTWPAREHDLYIKILLPACMTGRRIRSE